MSQQLAPNGHGAMSDMSPLSGVKRKPDFGAVRAAFDPLRTWGTPKIFNSAGPLALPSVEARQLHCRILIVGGVDATAGVYRTDHGRTEFSATGACTDKDATAGGWLFGPIQIRDRYRPGESRRTPQRLAGRGVRRREKLFPCHAVCRRRS